MTTLLMGLEGSGTALGAADPGSSVIWETGCTSTTS